jgi:hypothetical protein
MGTTDKNRSFITQSCTEKTQSNTEKISEKLRAFSVCLRVTNNIPVLHWILNYTKLRRGDTEQHGEHLLTLKNFPSECGIYYQND